MTPRATDCFEGQQLDAAKAIELGNVEQLRVAVRGLDIDKPGKKQMTLLWFAISVEAFESIETLVHLGSKPDEQIVQGLGTPILYALMNKDLRFLRAMLNGGLSVNHTGISHASLLFLAAGPEGASLDHVRLLVERGADLELADSLGDTPLISAIDTHHVDRARYLLEHGAKVDVYPVTGATPAWGLHCVMRRQASDSPLRPQLEALRHLMIAKGAKFPPDPPEVVRAWMKTQGMDVAH